MSSSDPTPPRKKKGLLSWQFALLAVCGTVFGLYNLSKHLFSPDPEFTPGYLIFSVVLDLVVVLACGITVTFFIIQRATSGNSGTDKR